jgi:hypothetical protein
MPFSTFASEPSALRRASRISRIGDFAGVLLVVTGFVSYLWTEGAMRMLTRRAGAPGGTAYGAVAEADRLWMVSRVGLALILGGLLVLVVTAIVAHRARRTPGAPIGPDEPAPMSAPMSAPMAAPTALTTASATAPKTPS